MRQRGSVGVWLVPWRFFLPNVWLPHAVAVVLGVMLFTAAAALDASGAEHLHL
jgi:hypothetical protein